ncbi:MAG: response regulator [Deltaproteobacteria bacterium]|nr:response regulator [Deltaproteobacteria bacterium]
MSKNAAHILVVDDEKDTCLLLNQVLEREGYIVDSANSGVEALNILKKKKINLVITDLKMPEMDGLTLIREARKLKMNTKFIMMTAYGEIETYLDAINMGAFDYLNKPMEISDIRKAVKKALQVGA